MPPTNRVYFAYPMEQVPFHIQKSVDYVIYDNEPAYPKLEDIKENYLGRKRVNFREQFEIIRDYFYRREMGGYANVEEAKDGQRKAAICIDMYNQAGDLRYKKETAEDVITQSESDIRISERALKEKRAKLKEYKDFQTQLNEQTKLTKKAQRDYNQLLADITTLCNKDKDIQKITGDKVPFIPDMTIGLRNDIKNLENASIEYAKISSTNDNNIKNVNNAIQQLKKNIQNAKALIVEKQALIENCKVELEPMFNTLAEHIKNFKVQR